MIDDRILVYCRACGYQFFSKSKTPRCPECTSSLIQKTSDMKKIPLIEFTKLKKEFKEYKKSNVELFNLLIDRIEAVEKKL